MPTVCVIGGYGAVGSRLCSLLCGNGVRVRIAGRNFDKASALAGRLGALASPAAVDATDPASLEALCRDGDLLANCAGPYRIIRDRPALAALSAGIPYMDAAGDEYLMGILEPRAPEFAASGRPFLLSCGTYPGLSGLFPRAMATRLLDSVEGFSLYTDFSRCTVTWTAAYDIVSTLQKDTGSGMAFWEGGELRRDAQGVRRRRIPGLAGERVLYPCFSEEMRRLAGDIGAFEGHAYLSLSEANLGSLFEACAPGLSEEAQKEAAQKLVEAFDANEPETHFFLEIEGERAGLPCAYEATLHAGIGSLQYVSDIMAASALLLLEGQGVPGAGYLAGGLDPCALLDALEREGASIAVSSPG